MSIAMVNGFVCFSGCDAAKARMGEDPRERTNPAEPASAAKERDRSPAAELARAVADTTQADAVRPAGDLHPTDTVAARRTSQAVDLIV
jgi:hypothetical protein